MASSGSVTTSSYQNRSVTVDWEISSQSVTNNTSTIKYTIKGSGSATSWYNSGPFTLKMNGTTVFSSSDRIQLKNGTVVGSGTKTVTHDSDGTKSIKFELSAAIYSASVNCTGSKTVSLTTIPRKSTVKASKTSAKPGETNTITISRHSSSFTHTVKYTIGDTTGTIATKTSSTSLSFTIPKAVIKQAPAANQTCTITCTTYKGSTSLGSNTCTFTVGYYAPSTVTLSSGTGMINDNVVASITKSLSEFKVNVTYSFEGSNETSILNNSSETTATIPTSVSAFAPRIPDSESGVLTVRVGTYYDGVKVGATKSATISLKLPSNIIPTISNFGWSDDITGYGYPIANKSRITLSLSCGGVYNSTIKQVVYTVGNYSTTAKVNNVTSWCGTAPTTAITSTSWGYSVYVVDSRGRKSAAIAASNLTALSYSAPKFTATFYRSDAQGNAVDDGTYVTTKITNYSISPLNNKNTRKVAVYRGAEAVYAGTMDAYQGTSKLITTSGWSVDNSYIVKVAVQDDFSTTNATGNITPTFTLINFNAKGNGIAFGGVSTEENKFQCYLPIYADKDVIIKSGARLGHASGNGIYLGNSGNHGYIYCQDMASQLSTSNWLLRQDGWMRLKKGVNVGNETDEGGLKGYTTSGAEADIIYLSIKDNIVLNHPDNGTGSTNIYGGKNNIINLGVADHGCTVKHNGNEIMAEPTYSSSSTTKSIPSATWTNTNSKVTLHAGTWIVSGRVYFAAATGKRRGIRLYNSTASSDYARSSTLIGGSTTSQAISPITSCILTLNSSATIYLQAYQDTGKAVDVTSTQIYAVCVG